MKTTLEYIDFYLNETCFYLLPVDQQKRPLTPNGVKNATRCRAELISYLDKHPDMGLAVAGGPLSKVVCIDKDVKRGVSGDKSLKQLLGDRYHFDYNNHLWATTPSGGTHEFFRWDDNYPVTSIIGAVEGVDIKGAGGYFLVEPSIVVYPDGSQGQYHFNDITSPIAPMPEWFPEIFKPPQTDTRNESVNIHDLVKGVHQGQREQSIFNAAWLLRKSGVDFVTAKAFIAEVASRCRPPFPQREAEQKVKRAYTYRFHDPK